MHEARATGAIGVLPYGLHVSIHLSTLDGRRTQAYADGSEGVRIAAEVDNQGHRHRPLGHLALIEAAQGREDECRAYVAEALEATEGTERSRSRRSSPSSSSPSASLSSGRGGAQTPAGGHSAARDRPLWAPFAAVARRSGRGARPPRGPHRRADLVAAIDAAAVSDFDGSAAVAERCHAMLAEENVFSAHSAGLSNYTVSAGHSPAHVPHCATATAYGAPASAWMPGRSCGPH